MILINGLYIGFGLNIDNNYPTICLNEFTNPKISAHSMLVEITSDFNNLIQTFSSLKFSEELNHFLYRLRNVDYFEDKERNIGKFEISRIDQNGNLILKSEITGEDRIISPNKYSFNHKEKIIMPISI